MKFIRQLRIFYQFIFLLSSIKFLIILIIISLSFLFYFDNIIAVLTTYIRIIRWVSILILRLNWSFLRFIIIIIFIGGLAVYYLIFISTNNLANLPVQLKFGTFLERKKDILVIFGGLSRFRYRATVRDYRDKRILFRYIRKGLNINFLILIVHLPLHIGLMFSTHGVLIISLIRLLTVLLFGITRSYVKNYFPRQVAGSLSLIRFNK